MISKAIKLTKFSSEESLPQSPRKGLETRAIVACGGKYTLCYLPEKDEWKRLADGLSERNECTQMMNYRDQLFAFSAYVKAERYDPVFDCWSTLDHLELPRENTATVTVVRGEIYSIEIDTSSKQSTIKRFNVERCSWQTVFSSHEGCRGGSCVVASGNHLYVCGGKLGSDSVTKAERFDTVENKWEEIANMQQARGYACGVTTEGKIFVAGGRENCGLSVECYDATEDRWIEKTTIPVKMICKDNDYTFTGCVLKLSKGVLDRLDVIKE